VSVLQEGDLLDTLPDEIGVAGRWRRGNGPAIRVRNPADGSFVKEIHEADRDDTEEAVAGAVDALASSGWATLLPHERAGYLHRVSALLRDRLEPLARLNTINTGKTLSESRGLVASAAGTFQFFAAAAETYEGDVTPSRGPYVSMSVWQPVGVVAAITPWNSPAASEAQKVAPALAAGNAVIVKPAQTTPLIALAMGRLIEEAGVPPGLVSVLPGRGSGIGNQLVQHPDVGLVSFTGSTEVGRSIGKIAAERVIPASLELGGKSPTIVLEDADIEQAMAGILYGIFASSGQTCVAGSRLFLPASLYDEFLEELVRRASALTVGPGLDPKSKMGPLITPEHRDRVHEYVELARAEGGRVLCGGSAPDDPALAAGSFYLPTIIDGLPNSARTCQEEIFGPVLVAIPYENDAELLAMANDSSFGLACGIWTSNYQRAWRLARAIKAGNVWVNTYKQLSIATPFGGFKQSGIGREKGRRGIETYMHQQSIYLGMDETPLPWATS
jgi:betaine-aldehyde dehydrogenase